MQEEGERMTRCMMRADDLQAGEFIFCCTSGSSLLSIDATQAKTESTRLAETHA
jgi:hypothetical protein